METLKIRKATKKDVPLILDFIRMIADYEKLSDSLTVTEDILNESLFGNDAKAEVIFGYFENEAVAYAVYFYNFSTFVGRNGLYLEDLFVKPEHRGKGLGKILLKHLAKLAVENNCGRMEWTVLDWNRPAIDFYKSIGAVSMDGWSIFRLDETSLRKFTQDS
ncbi:MAG: GNAT family N-acetyltransferase [Ignavibacteria bacterium]|nr:GNAT family N-acetyltransferase [Ignavibacteria bacterium]MDP3831616.1 GNAT family N-acetyltransferase [Ignavibacteriaceae bacterium]